MKLFQTLLFLLFPLSIFAQVSITHNDMAQPGDTARLSTADPGAISNYINSGPGSTWDYSNLQATGSERVEFQYVQDAPSFLFQIAFARSSYMTEGTAPQNLRAFGMGEEAWEFYEVKDSALDYMGYGAYVDSFPTPIIYSHADRIYSLPMAYGHQSVNVGTYELNVPNNFYYSQEISRGNWADGYGTLKLPMGDFMALRLRSDVVQSDSLYVDSLGFGFNLPPTEYVEYKWLVNGEPVPVLEMVETSFFGQSRLSSVKYLDEQSATARMEPLEEGKVICWPNPVENDLQVSVPKPCRRVNWLRILDAQGKVVLVDVFYENEHSVSLANLPAGAYFLETGNENGHWGERILVQ